jgi:GNAT superfamily N-acetyltransferase
MQVEIKRLAPKLTQDFLGFFDNTAFSDNPDWAECYCCFFYFGDSDWQERSGAMNRTYAEQAIISGGMHGYLAYIDGKPAGWINADNKNAYARLDNQDESEKVLSIVCFTIAPGHRRKGIATALLQAAVEDAAKDGYTVVEAYPAKDAATDAHNYHGPLDLYTKNGWAVVDETENSWVVRKSL